MVDMTALERQIHWQNVYQTKGERDVSWFQEMPTISLDLIRATGVGPDASIVDIGGGASRLVARPHSMLDVFYPCLSSCEKIY